MFIHAKIQDGLQQQLDFRCGACFLSENSLPIVGVNCKNYLLKSTYLFISKGVFQQKNKHVASPQPRRSFTGNSPHWIQPLCSCVPYFTFLGHCLRHFLALKKQWQNFCFCKKRDANSTTIFKSLFSANYKNCCVFWFLSPASERFLRAWNIINRF